MAAPPLSPNAHHDAGDDESADEEEDIPHGPRCCGQQFGGYLTQLRLQRLQIGRQVRGSSAPGCIDPFADDWPLGDGGRGHRNGHRVLGERRVGFVNLTGEGAGQHDRRRPEDDNDAQHQQSCRASLPAFGSASQALLQRIERDGQDQPPQQQIQEGRKNPEAHDHHHRDQSHLHQHIQHVLRQELSDRRILVTHGTPPHSVPCDQPPGAFYVIPR